MNQTVDAILACRVQGSRMYGKPLQPIVIGKLCIIESLMQYLREIKGLNRIVLAISEGEENAGFIELANKHNLAYTIGNQNDVLGRMLQVARQENIQHILRITNENPFAITEFGDTLIEEYFEGDYDFAAYKDAPIGTAYDIIKTSALEQSHRDGENQHRSELITSYICDNQNKFKMLFKELPIKLKRPEIRLTVDNPEDLIF